MYDSKKFIFTGWEVNLSKGKANFYYSIKSNKEILKFADNIYFPSVESSIIPSKLLNIILDNLSLVLGISYWKLYCPTEIDLGAISLNKRQADFWNTVYIKGLGELFYKNKIDFRNLVHFPYQEDSINPIAFPRKNRSLLAIGGGKDSIISGEFLKKHRKNFDAFVVNEHPIMGKVIEILGVNKIIFKHELDSSLFELNKRKGVYNGHVPISAQYAFLGLLSAVLYDYRFLIVSNEESANYGNVEYLGQIINHQWSKSVEFENLFMEYVSSFITPDFFYFSLLRPLKEIKITEVFAKYPQYFNSFSSCNKNFRINNDQSSIWCGQCPKCLFVFTMLSPFISKEKLFAIFGRNLFDDDKLLDLLKELLGFSKTKPFECVGTPQEIQYALYLASKKERFSGSFLMNFFEKEILPSINPMQLQKVMQVSSKENIPSEFKDIFNEI